MKVVSQCLRGCLLALLLVGLCVPACADGQSNTSLFRERVLPILRENCFGCHGAAHTSGLDMRTPIDLRKGGVRGAEIVRGAPNKSRLYRFVSGQEPIRMPPGKPLSPEDLAVLRDWIASGATWPVGGSAVEALPWAFRKPIRPSLPTVQAREWVKNPIDLFVLALLEAKGLKPAPPADRITLLRRVTFDLTGLPPTPEAIDAFLRDKSPDAYEKVVDRLLASPSYGECWARHWLDLARYAESEGFKSDEIRPDAWRYRDYVIASLNADKPYDRFVQEQIAGDELFPSDPDALVATGFNRHGPDESNATNLLQRRQEILNDITDTVGSSLLGLTVGCARCHNHKYDPIPQKDYYRLQAFFAAVRLQTDVPYLTPAQEETYQAQLKTWEEKTQDVRARLAKMEAPAREKFFQDRKKRFAPDVQEAIETLPAKRTPLQWILYHKAMPQLELGTIDVKSLKPDDQQAWKECQQELQKYAALKPALPVACAITDVGPEAPKTFTLAVGVYNAPRDETPPGYLSLLDPAPAIVHPVRPETTGRRAALARWLTDPSNPLTARVMVNRLWQQHFGRGIVGTPSDFGAMGDKPTHPELLDWLATEFMAGGSSASGYRNDAHVGSGAWSLKKMQRLMVTSATYRQSAAYNLQAGRVDPENRLLWHYTRRRLEGEAIRDAMLAVSGALNSKMGGSSVFPELPAGITTRGNWQDTKDPQERNRRSIYVFVKRNLRYPLFAAFDMPDTHESCGRRLVTITAPQALFLLNDAFALQSAQAFAARLLKEAGTNQEAQVRMAYRLAFSRLPESDEQANALAFLERQADLITTSASTKPPGPSSATLPVGVTPAQVAALTDLCHALLNADEFVYIE